MTTTRLLCVATTPGSIQIPPPPVPAAGSRAYSASQGGVIDVPGDVTGDSATLLNSGYFVLLAQSGATAGRPTYPKSGQPFVDTTINKPIWFDGAAWRDCTGESV
jgi:hypothetical protein